MGDIAVLGKCFLFYVKRHNPPQEPAQGQSYAQLPRSALSHLDVGS